MRYEPGASPLRVDGTAYRGRVLVYADGNRLHAVNVLSLDHYLRGVVPREMVDDPGAPPPERDQDQALSDSSVHRPWVPFAFFFVTLAVNIWILSRGISGGIGGIIAGLISWPASPEKKSM